VASNCADEAKTTPHPIQDELLQLHIRNTFIDGPILRPMSLEGFFQEREIRSCPASRPTSFDDFGMPLGLASLLESIEEAMPATPPTGAAKLEGRDAIFQLPSAGLVCTTSATMPPPPQEHAPIFSEASIPPPPATNWAELITPVAVPPPPAFDADTSMLRLSHLTTSPAPAPPSFNADASVLGLSYGTSAPPAFDSANAAMFCLNQTTIQAPPAAPSTLPTQACVLRLSQVLAEPTLGSEAFPTIGSAGHHTGQCKPCAFFHTKGCGNGTQCSFCHLCGPDEKKKRKSDKKELRRMAANQGTACNALSPACWFEAVPRQQHLLA
jgi:hypothetical protein